ncbi:unnamed protein product, partial [Arctogadus glacialis]
GSQPSVVIKATFQSSVLSSLLDEMRARHQVLPPYIHPRRRSLLVSQRVTADIDYSAAGREKGRPEV